MSIYSDVNATKTAPFNPLLKDIDAIFQSITTILGTRVGERIFEPEFGSHLEGLLFEPIHEITALKIYHEVIDAVDRWEHRVRIDYSQSLVIPDEERHLYTVTLVFDVIGLEEKKFELSYTLKK